ncbi:hypothetical protein DAI22_07g153250 [Oryza sativa Japonica Group]|nr:hypothetical protein DAI22_07g153250 [Oryza sativa Japonica Group]
MSATSQRLSSHCYPLAAAPRGSSLGLIISPGGPSPSSGHLSPIHAMLEMWS